jgi:dihydropyrimidinase
MYDLAILNGQLYIEGSLVKQHLYINGDHIVAISDEVHQAREIYDATDRWVMPGLIDPHVHFELDCGKYTSSDDFYTGSIAAAYGGITTVIDFLDPISSEKELEKAFNDRNQLAGKSMIDYRFHVTVKDPVNEVVPIVKTMKNLGLNSIKIFTTYSDSGRRTYDGEIVELLKLSRDEAFIVLAHIEKDDSITMEPSYTAGDLPISRPEMAETEEAIKLATLAKETNGHLYMVHVSSGNTLEALVKAFPEILGKNLYLESCPHYFEFNEERFEGSQGHLYTMAPPLRSEASREKLINGFDYLHTIATDHCPFTEPQKNQKQLLGMPLGIGGVEHSFSLMATRYGIKAIDKMSTMPAKIFGLYPKKGSLDVGSDADIAIYNPNITHKIEADHSKAGYTVYKDLEVSGQIETTLCKGQFIIKNNALVIGSVGHFMDIS